MTGFSESVVEDAALAWLSALGYTVRHGPDLAAGQPAAARADALYRDTVLAGRLHDALTRLNPSLPAAAIDDAARKLLRADAPSLMERNRAAHRLLVDGVGLEYRRPDGSIGGVPARVVDFDTPSNTDWLAVNQFTMADGQHTRRPDVVIFVTGLPLGVIELKNAAAEKADVWAAFHQLETYQAQIPALFATNAVLIATDGVQARIGAIGANKEWFKPWRTVTGRGDAPAKLSELQVVLEGVFEHRRFLDLLRYFVVFEDATDGGGSLIKKLAGYHQFHAVNVAVEETLRAAETTGTRNGRTRSAPSRAPRSRSEGHCRYSKSRRCLRLLGKGSRKAMHGAPEAARRVKLDDRTDRLPDALPLSIGKLGRALGGERELGEQLRKTLDNGAWFTNEFAAIIDAFAHDRTRLLTEATS